MEDILKQFKRKNTSQFKEKAYEVEINITLLMAASALMKFNSTKLVIVNNYKDRIDAQINEVSDSKLNDEYKENKELSLLIKCMLQCEKYGIQYMLDILNENFIKNINNEAYLRSLIHSPDDGKRIALSIGAVDDYMVYLERKLKPKEVLSNA